LFGGKDGGDSELCNSLGELQDVPGPDSELTGDFSDSSQLGSGNGNFFGKVPETLPQPFSDRSQAGNRRSGIVYGLQDSGESRLEVRAELDGSRSCSGNRGRDPDGPALTEGPQTG